MAKQILYGDEARSKMKIGIDAVANAVKITIGPKGRNVALDRGWGGPVITNDGVSITKEIVLSDKIENMGAEILKEVADKMNKSAGDGTTTAVVLAHSLITEGLKRIQTGVEAVSLKKGIDMAVAEIIELLKKSAKTIKTNNEIRQVATISVENEEFGKVIADTIQRVGTTGVVTVEESSTSEITSDIVEGMSIDRGYTSPYMVTDNDRVESVFNNPFILVTDKRIDNIKDILPLLEKMIAQGKKELIVIADDFSNEAIAAFVLNKMRGIFNILAIKSPGFGEKKKDLLIDIAIAVGATPISIDTGFKLEEVDAELLGSAQKVIATKDKTVLISGKGKKVEIESRIKSLQTQMISVKSVYDKEKLAERIAKMTGGVAIIRVGAATETEMKYLKLKIEDAVNATKAALEEGIVAGGGSALVSAATILQSSIKSRVFEILEHKMAYDIVISACFSPLRQIAINAGMGDGSIVVSRVSEMGIGAGYNASTDSYVKNMITAGIVDPLKVTRNTLSNAASAAGIFLTTEVAIAEIPELKQPEAGNTGGY